MSKAFTKLLLILPVILISVFVNVFISTITSQTVFLQLVTYGVEKDIALIISIVVAVGTYSYIVFYHRIRDFIQDNGAIEK